MLASHSQRPSGLYLKVLELKMCTTTLAGRRFLKHRKLYIDTGDSVISSVVLRVGVPLRSSLIPQGVSTLNRKIFEHLLSSVTSIFPWTKVTGDSPPSYARKQGFSTM